jgi:hypothetical protein
MGSGKEWCMLCNLFRSASIATEKLPSPFRSPSLSELSSLCNPFFSSSPLPFFRILNKYYHMLKVSDE